MGDHAGTGPGGGRGPFLLAGAELITFKVRGPAYSLFENVTRAGYGGPPPHRHLRQDEGFYVLEGRFSFQVDGRTLPAPPGTFVNVPKGSLHTFRTEGTGVGRLLVVVAPPGDFESFVEEAGDGVAMTVPPELPAGPPSAETLRRILSAAARHRLDIASPPKPEK
ncbi:MAG TPA: cupin domain-containing protein [bacterium]|nr:cupin domain-containing protein [bacterium]